MRLLAGIGIALALAGGAAVVEARIAPAPGNVDAFVQRYVAEGKVPGIVVAIGREGQAPVFHSAGRIAAEPTAAAAGPDSLWRVYSMTKPLTAMAAMILIEEGKIKLDEPVSDFIPAFRDMKVLTDPQHSLATRPATRPITIRNLLTHTAGLGYNIITTGPLLDEYNRLGINPAQVSVALEKQSRATRPATLEAFANQVATLPLIADPGTKWSYSIGLDVMGRVIEVASGMPFDTFLKTRIFDPLKMTSSFFTVPASEAGRLATNYFYMGETRIALDPGATSVYLTPPSFPYGGAGLVMSARDYDRFLWMLQNGGTLDGVRIMKPETVALAMSNLLPPGVDTSMLNCIAGHPGRLGFGAGGSVYLEDVPGGAGKGTYGWGGAAATIAFVDPVRHVRGTVMVNYMLSEHWPLRADADKAIAADLGQ
jgi:CubicO group peptidase (beta-lactamase class C family)